MSTEDDESFHNKRKRQQKEPQRNVRFRINGTEKPSRDAAAIRQDKRLEAATARNAQVIGKSTTSQMFCSNYIEDHLPPTLKATEPRYHDKKMINNIQDIINSDQPSLTAGKFAWKLDQASAKHNVKILAEYKYDVDACIQAQVGSICQPGSKFRSINHLYKLYRRHPNWSYMKKVLKEGADMIRRSKIDDAQRNKENAALLKYNNHKGAKKNLAIIIKAVTDDVTHGFACALTTEAVKNLPDAMMCALGMVNQRSLLPNGDIVMQPRLTNDQTYVCLPESISVNKNTDITQLPDMFYGCCLLQLLHQIVTMRLHFPNAKIFGIKGDVKLAYRRMHYNGM